MMFLKRHRRRRDYFLRRCHPDWSEVKHFEPITVVQRHSGDETTVLKLSERMYYGSNKGVYTVRWTPSVDVKRLRIQQRIARCGGHSYLLRADQRFRQRTRWEWMCCTLLSLTEEPVRARLQILQNDITAIHVQSISNLCIRYLLSHTLSVSKMTSPVLRNRHQLHDD